MFEKQAEKWISNNFKIYLREPSVVVAKYAFKDGAEFGYNKANEWHYPSKGEYPSNRNDVYLLQLEDDNGHTEYEIGSLGSDRRWTCEEFGIRIIAWKEIVLPELKESE